VKRLDRASGVKIDHSIKRRQLTAVLRAVNVVDAVVVTQRLRILAVSSDNRTHTATSTAACAAIGVGGDCEELERPRGQTTVDGLLAR
jgi:hypothetical protein